MKLKYNPVGTTFKEGDLVLKVQVSEGNKPTCAGCYYGSLKKNRSRVYPYSCCVHGHVCTPYYRKDKKHVVFRKVQIA